MSDTLSISTDFTPPAITGSTQKNLESFTPAREKQVSFAFSYLLLSINFHPRINAQGRTSQNIYTEYITPTQTTIFRYQPSFQSWIPLYKKAIKTEPISGYKGGIYERDLLNKRGAIYVCDISTFGAPKFIEIFGKDPYASLVSTFFSHLSLTSCITCPHLPHITDQPSHCPAEEVKYLGAWIIHHHGPFLFP